MFIKTTRSKQGEKTYVNHYLAESYWDPDKQAPRNRNLVSLDDLPEDVIETLRRVLSDDYEVVNPSEFSIRNGDSLRGAGSVALWRAWEKTNMDRVLKKFSDKQIQSIKTMVFSRITDPCSKLALKQRMADHILSRLYSKTRLNEDTLYEVMDGLYEQFEEIQNKLQTIHHNEQNRLILYDTTSTYFEGTQAEPGEYGHSKDHRWDRYQIIVGMVTDKKGLPMAVRVWRGNTHDASTVNESIEILRNEFDLKQVVFVGDSGMYGEDQLEDIEEASYDYIVSLAYKKQKKRLSQLAPEQLELFDEKGHYEWNEGNTRYVGCHSEAKKKRAQSRRKQALNKAREKLNRLGETVRKGRYYHKMRLYEKTQGILKKHGVADVLTVDIQPLENGLGDEENGLFKLDVEVDQLALEQRKTLEGKYILQTSLSREEKPAAVVESDYRRLQNVERGFRHIKSYLKIRPIHHRLEKRIKAHVLICFLAYFMVKWMELQLREQGETREVEMLIRRWDQLRLVNTRVSFEGVDVEEYRWCRGERGKQIIGEMKEVGWWQSVNSYKHSITKQLKKPS
jgi:transposase